MIWQMRGDGCVIPCSDGQDASIPVGFSSGKFTGCPITPRSPF
jgi:hypothetical protein